MESALYWFGLIHAVAYIIAGFLLASWLFVEWVLKRLGIYRDLVRALGRYYADKAKAERG